METTPPHFFAAYPDRNVNVIVAVFEKVHFQVVFGFWFAIRVVTIPQLFAQRLVRLRRPFLNLTLEVPLQLLAFHSGIFLHIVAGGAAPFLTPPARRPGPRRCRRRDTARRCLASRGAAPFRKATSPGC